MAPGKPIYSLYPLGDWQQELGRPLTEADLTRLASPGGEASWIAELAATGHPITMYSPYVPGDKTRTNRFWDPHYMGREGEPHYYTIFSGGVYYDVRGVWFDGHGQFVAHDAKWRPAHEDGDERTPGYPVTSLKKKILAVAIEMRAAEIIGQTAWLKQIVRMDEAERLAALAELLEEGSTFVTVELSRGDGGSGGVNFRGLAGLGGYHLDWHRDGTDVVVDRVYLPARAATESWGRKPATPGRRRRPLRMSWQRDRMLIELVRLAVAGRPVMANM